MQGPLAVLVTIACVCIRLQSATQSAALCERDGDPPSCDLQQAGTSLRGPRGRMSCPRLRDCLDSNKAVRETSDLLSALENRAQGHVSGVNRSVTALRRKQGP